MKRDDKIEEKNRPEHALLVCSAQPKLTEELSERTRSILRQPLDWNYLINLANEHRVIPALYNRLKDFSEEAPAEPMSDLRGRFRQIAATNLALTGKLLKLLALLRENDISAIPYKGPILAQTAYGDIRLRQFIDLDIFVRKRDVYKVKELFLANYKTAKAHVDFLLDPRQHELWIVHSEEDAEIDLQSYFVGPALGCILRLRNTVCLHGSVVKIDDHAIAILGKKGSGKSTSAAALAQLGVPMLSDDLAVLTPRNDGFQVQPGYPQLRLWPSSIQALYPNCGPLSRVITNHEKRYLQLSDGGPPGATFWYRPLPLGAIYILAEATNGRATPHVEAIAPKDKLISLVANTYGSYVVMEELRQREFVLLAQVTKTVPVQRLISGQDLISLPAQSKVILEDFRGHNVHAEQSQNEFVKKHAPSQG